MRLGFRVGVAVVLVAAGTVGAGWFLLGEGLDRAEKWVSIVGVYISVVVNIAGLFLGWRAWQQARMNRQPVPAVTVRGAGAVGVGGSNRSRIRTDVSGVEGSPSASPGRGVGVRADGAGSVAVGGDNTAPINTRVTGAGSGQQP